MRRLPCLACVLFLLTLGAFGPLCSGGAGPRRSVEDGTVAISDFSGAQLSNLSLRSDGGVSLIISSYYTGLPGITVSSAPGTQRLPKIAMSPEGTSLVVWQDNRHGHENSALYAQRLDPELNKIGNEIRISESTQVEDPDVALDSRGNYLVVWGITNYGGIRGQRLDSSGAPLGATFVVNNLTDYGHHPAVAAARDSYCVAWGGLVGRWTGYFDIYGQMLDLDGKKQGPENLLAGGDLQQEFPDITATGEDRFVVGWSERGQDNELLIAKGFDSNWTEQTDRLIVDNRDEYKSFPCVEAMENGSWAIAWSQWDEALDCRALFMRTFDSNGNPLKGPFVVATRVDAYPQPGLEWTPDDELVVYWADFRGSPSDQGSLWARRVSRDGTLLGEEMAVSATPSTEHGSSLAATAQGDLYFTWSDESTTDIHARRFLRTYAREGTLVTQDIPAPADLARWSSLSASVTFQNASANMMIFEYSLDSGTTWFTVPGDGSLAGAGSASPLRLRALFSTMDNRTTPILYNLTLGYVKGSGPPVNHRPGVSAGPDLVAYKNTTVVLAASGSDEDGDALTYCWTQLEGPALLQEGRNTPSLSFIPSRSGMLRFCVIARDQLSESPPALVNVTVLNRVPTASVPSDIACIRDELVILNATGYDPDGDELVFTWTQVSDGPRYLDNFTGRSASFIADMAGVFLIQVVASDGEAKSPPAFVNLTVHNHGHHPPTVTAGDDISCFKRSRVQLGCNASDPEGGPISFTWTQVSGEPQALNDPSGPAPWFFANQSGIFRFRVVASDGGLASEPAFVNVTVLNRNPTLTAIADITCRKNEQVILRADGSDPDGDALAFTWTQVSGKYSYFKSRTGPEISLEAVRSGTYVFRVVASDGEVDSAPALVEVKVLSGTESTTIGEPPLSAVILFLAIVAGFVALMVHQRRRAKRY